MSTNKKRVLVDSILEKPALSLTEVRWVVEVEAEAYEDDEDDGDTVSEEKEMINKEMFEPGAARAQYRLDSLEAAAEALAKEGSFLPGRFWLIDDQTIGVHSIVGKYAYHVGFLTDRYTDMFRKSMKLLDLEGETLEVLGSFTITKGRTESYLRAMLYLPIDFAESVKDGYSNKPENRPSWLMDASPVTPRLWQGRNAEGFTDDELCKMCCWYAKKKMFNSLPHRCEPRADGLRHCGGGVPLEMESFVLHKQ